MYIYKVADTQICSSHVLTRTQRGAVYAWGQKTRGQLGLNSAEPAMEPKLIDVLSPEQIKQICVLGVCMDYVYV